MVNVPGYTLGKKVTESHNLVVYKGYLDADKEKKEVLLKVIKVIHPNPAALVQLKIDYAIIKKIKARGLRKTYEIKETHDGVVLIQEDFDGVSLEAFQDHKPLDLGTFYNIAIQLSDTLGDIHSHNIIHKAIRPRNIFVNQGGQGVQIGDFGVLAPLTKENESLYDQVTLEEFLPYISPEQSGRMNRAVDYRTDLYSLGIVFYEMLTGCLPFKVDNPLEIIHFHLAQKAVYPTEVDERVPPVLSDIIMKLLSKAPENRYQRAYGLKADLVICQTQWKQHGKVSTFALGTKDISDKFSISSKIYGREKDIDELMKAFEKVSKGSVEMLLVTGYAGIGKSVLVQEIHKPIVRLKGYFVSGKFDQLYRNIAYSAITQAFQGLVRQILSESEMRISSWRDRLLSVLKPNAQVIIDVIPEVEMVIGPQPPVPVLGANENQNRFNRVFQEFCNVFAQKEHPLVLFLDDLQWADSPTLNLIKLMMTDLDNQYLFFIGAYRDNEVNKSHPLMRTLDEIQVVNPIRTITLKPLHVNHVNDLISNTLKSSQAQTFPLTNLVYGKTNGNPFFVTMFLKTLYQENLIKFIADGGKWNWDMNKIEEKDITDNVVQLMVGRIHKLPEKTQLTLSLAACIGNQFDLNTLSVICESSATDTFKKLWFSIQQGLILTVERGLKNVIPDREEHNKGMFRFLHDRVQQAAYSLIADKDRPELHLKIGRLMLKSVKQDELDENVFEVVHHLNKGKSLIRDSQEKSDLARLNLKAAIKAKLSSAYQPALNYVTVGMECLPDNSWADHYDLTFSYSLEKGEIEYLNASWDDAIETFDKALKEVRGVVDRCKVNEYRATLYRMKNDLRTALSIGVDALGELGIQLKNFPDDEEVREEIKKINPLIIGKDFESFYYLKELKDPSKLAAMALLVECFAPAYFLGSKLISIIGMRMTEITIRDGICPLSAPGCIFYSAITLAHDLSDFDNAYKFGKLALEINDEKYHAKVHEALIFDMWGTFVCHHKDPLDDAREWLIKGFYSGVENGSYQWAGYCGMIHLFMTFWGKHTLGDVSKKIEKISPIMGKIDPNMVQYYYAVKAMVFNLTETVEDRSSLSELVWPDLNELLRTSREQDDLLTLLVDATCRLTLANIYSEYGKAAEYAEIAEKYVLGSPGVFINPVFHFHQCLAFCSAYEYVDDNKKRIYLEKINSNLSKLDDWANHSPTTYLHQALLVKAELARITGNSLEAMGLFDKSIDSAYENGFLQNEAIANELAAKFYFSRGKKKIALFYLGESYYAYQRWGANAKLLYLKETYPDLITDPNVLSGPSPKEIDIEPIDLLTVIKASQAISEEIDLDQLIKKMMKIIIENAGAQKGFLVLKKKGKLVIEAEGTVGKDEVSMHQSSPLEETPNISTAIVSYVARTLKNIVLEDAVNEGPFTTDSYVLQNQPKSVLCQPIIKQKLLIGILYLENNLTTNAFTPNRLEILNILSSQVAISLENALFYQELQQEIYDRKQTELALERSNKDLEQFAYVASHDLQEPLRMVASYMELLDARYKGKLDADADEFIGFAVDGAKRMQTLIQDLLTCSRVGKYGKTFEQRDSGELLEMALSNLRKAIEDGGAKITHDKLPTVNVDGSQLVQLFQNLISNAIKFRSEDPPRIHVSVECQGNEWVFSVCDNGIGIDMEHADRIFVIFQRLHGKSRYPGSGIGLTICQKIVERHKGGIWIKSELGKGSIFYFSLPVV